MFPKVPHWRRRRGKLGKRSGGGPRKEKDQQEAPTARGGDQPTQAEAGQGAVSDDGAREAKDEAGEGGRSKGREQNVIHGGSRSYTSLPQGAWGWPKRATGNQFNGGKEANAARDYTSRSPMSQRDGGRGQEGPSSKKRAVQISNQRQEGARRNRGWKSRRVNSWQQEPSQAQHRGSEKEKHESIDSAQIDGTDEDGTNYEEEAKDKEEATEEEPSDPEPA